MIRIIVNGYGGRLGSAICEAAKHSQEIVIAAGIDAKPDDTNTFPVYSRIAECEMPADVIIDCSVAAVVPQVIEYALLKSIPAVICTTGLDENTIALISKASETLPVFKSANMSLGINLIANLLEKAYAVLADSDFDIEIIEKHHNKKVDAPSGTALLLADAINNAASGKYEYICDRSQVRKQRDAKELGIHAVRGGTIVGEHTVIFAGDDEIIEISHSARSKEVFAVGAIKAAKFMSGKAPGLYNMQDLINEA